VPVQPTAIAYTLRYSVLPLDSGPIGLFQNRRQLTPWSRILLDELTVAQPANKFLPLTEPQVYCRSHKSPSLVPPEPHECSFQMHFFKTDFSIILPSTLRSSSGIRNKIPYLLLLHSLSTTCSIHILLDLITLTHLVGS
jgi:hypothetical protein